MTFLHLLVLLLGAIGAVAAADVLAHRHIGPWPVGVLALALVVVAGWLFDPWIAALSLGLALGTGIMLVADWLRSSSRRRRARREQARLRREARDGQLPLRREDQR